jgi:hypothetical protein
MYDILAMLNHGSWCKWFSIYLSLSWPSLRCTRQDVMSLLTGQSLFYIIVSRVKSAPPAEISNLCDTEINDNHSELD